jgi:hypothetical protein
MTIPEISKKYGISEAYLNAKDDALQIAAASLLDLKVMIEKNTPRAEVAAKLQFLSDFLYDVKNSNH